MTEWEIDRPSRNGDDAAVVSIIDSDDAVGQTIASIVSSLPARASVFRSPETFVYSYRDTPGCVLYDIEQATQSGLDFQSELSRRGCNAPVLMMGNSPDLQTVVEGMEAGAETFLQKPLDRERTACYIEAALAKDRARRIELGEKQSIRDRYEQLTAKEREVIDRILLGATNREIAASLGISVRAVEDRRSRIMRRMEANSLVQLVDLVRAAEAAI